MAGENLTVQQRAFIEKYLSKSFFSGKKNKATTKAYEDYLVVEKTFMDAMSSLPGEDLRVKAIGGRASGAMAKKNTGDFSGAAGDLQVLIQETNQLAPILQGDHRVAVRDFNTAMTALPPAEPRAIDLANRAATPLGATALTDLPKAAVLLGQLEGEAKQLALTLTAEHGLAVTAYQLAFSALPPEDDRTKSIDGRAAGPVAVTAPAGMAAAIVTLGQLEAQAKQLALTLSAEHGLAVSTYEVALSVLPPGDDRVKSIAGRATGPLSVAAPVGMAAAAVTLTSLTDEARLLATTIKQEFDKAVLDFRAVMNTLPPAETRTKDIEGRAAGSLGAAPTAYSGSVVMLGTLTVQAGAVVTAIGVEHTEAVRLFRLAIDVLPAADKRVAAVATKAAGLPEKTTPIDRHAATLTLTALMSEIEAAALAIATDKTELLRDLAKLTDPVGATTDELAAMKVERDRALAAMTDTHPTPANFLTARNSMAELKSQIQTAKSLAALEASSPKTAAGARDAMKEFDAVLGGVEVSPELIAATRKELTASKELLFDAMQAMADADDLPQDTPEEILLRDAAIQAAEDAGNLEKAKYDILEAKNRALLGKANLSEALTFGPLSPGSGRPLSDDTAEKVVGAMRMDPELTGGAMALLQKSADPDALADGIVNLCEKAADLFEDDAGRSFPDPDSARAYAANLLKAAAFMGGTYFAEMDDYIKSGRQFKSNPLGPVAGTYQELASDRSKALGSSMLAPDGSFDPSNPKAVNALNDLQFNPDILRNATPSLAKHAKEATKQLIDNKVACGTIIDGATAPTNGSAKGLVGKAVGKTGAVTDEDTKVAILGAFFAPIDQGPVGSCFTTAPARRFREEKPVDVLKGFSDIATKGKFKSATGTEVPAVTKLGPGENPIMSSWQYSVASAAATDVGSRERNKLRDTMNAPGGNDKIAELAGGGNELKKKAFERSLKMAVGTAFNFEYDATSTVTDANDGSSSTGRYQLLKADAFGAPTGAPIVTKDKFVEEMTAITLKAMSVDATSPEGILVIDYIKSDAYINAVCPGKYKPWELPSGGMELGPTKAMFGGTPETKTVLARAVTPPIPKEGDRTKAVLAGLSDLVANSTDRYFNIGTEGMHSFNALPQEPARKGEFSMKDLSGGTSVDTLKNIEDNVITPGKLIADTALPADKAAYLFDKQINLLIAAEKDDAVRDALKLAAKAERPSADAKPGDVQAAVTRATDVYDKARAKRRAEEIRVQKGWLDGSTEHAKSKADLEKAFAKLTKDASSTLLINELGAPQVVMADTNWGNERTHTYFVAVPDPVSGELIMWKRTDPDNTFSPAGRDWVDTLWDKTE